MESSPILFNIILAITLSSFIFLVCSIIYLVWKSDIWSSLQPLSWLRGYISYIKESYAEIYSPILSPIFGNYGSKPEISSGKQGRYVEPKDISKASVTLIKTEEGYYGPNRDRDNNTNYGKLYDFVTQNFIYEGMDIDIDVTADYTTMNFQRAFLELGKIKKRAQDHGYRCFHIQRDEGGYAPILMFRKNNIPEEGTYSTPEKKQSEE